MFSWRGRKPLPGCRIWWSRSGNVNHLSHGYFEGALLRIKQFWVPSNTFSPFWLWIVDAKVTTPVVFCSFSSEISNIGYTVLRVSWAVRVLAATALTKVFSEHKAITSQSLQIAVGYQTEKRFILFPNLIQKHSQNSILKLCIHWRNYYYDCFIFYFYYNWNIFG